MVDPVSDSSPDSDDPRSNRQGEPGNGPDQNENSPELNREQALALVAREKSKELVEVVRSHRSVGLSTESPQFESLVENVEKLFSAQLPEEGWQAFQDLAAAQITNLTTLSNVAKMLKAFQGSRPSADHWPQLVEKLNVTLPAVQDRDRALNQVTEFVRQAQSGGNALTGFDSLLGFAEKGIEIAKDISQSNLTLARRESFLNILNQLVHQEGSFDQIDKVSEHLGEGVEAPFAELAAQAYSGAFKANEEISDSYQALSSLRSKVTDDPKEHQALVDAIDYHVDKGWQVVSVLESLDSILKEYSGSNRAEAIDAYGNLTAELMKYNVPLSQLRPDHVRDFTESEGPQYARALVRHVREVDEMLSQARSLRSDDGRWVMGHMMPPPPLFDSEQLEVFFKLAAAGPDPGAIATFQAIFSDVKETSNDPAEVLESLGKLLDAGFSPREWDGAADVIRHQVSRNSEVDSVLKNIVQVKVAAADSDVADNYVTNYLSLCSSLEPTCKDLKRITPGIHDYYQSNPSVFRQWQVSEALKAADGISTHLPWNDRDVPALAEELLRNDLGQVVLSVAQEQGYRGLDHVPVFKHYPVLRDHLSDNEVELLEQAVNYQIENGFSLSGVFRNFAELAKQTQESSSDDETQAVWTEYEQLIQQVRQQNIPLDYLGAGMLAEYSSAADKDEAVGSLATYLNDLRELGETPVAEGAERSDKRDQLLHGLGDIGSTGGGLEVIRNLLVAEDESSVLTLDQIAEALEREPGASVEAWRAIGDNIERYREEGLPLASLVEVVGKIDREASLDSTLHKDFWKSFSEVSDDLRAGGVQLDILSKRFLEDYSRADEQRQVLLGMFARAVAQFGERVREESGVLPAKIPTLLANITSESFGLTDNPAMVHKLNLIIADGGLETLADFELSIRELKMYALTDVMRNSRDEDRRDWARKLMAREFNMGGPPYPVETPEAQKHHNETMEVVDRAFRDNKGFGGFAIDCRGVPQSQDLESVPPLMVRFAADSAREVRIANASTNMSYPGKGVQIIGMDPENLFAPDPNWEDREKDSPFWQWTEGSGLFANEYFHNFEMEDLRDAEFVMLRGVMAVMNPGNSRFELDGVNYSYVVFNRHFYPGTEAACLVPTEILQDLLKDGFVDVNEYRGFDSDRADLSEIRLDYKSLLAACEERNMNLLNLTYGSVIGGGLCNAYLPESDPHYTWEREDGGGSMWQDTWGHTHKSWVVRSWGWGPYETRAGDMDEDLKFARDAHENVYEVSRALQGELDAFRFALSFYKMGTTLTQEGDERGGDQDQDQEEEEEQEQFMDEEEEENPEFDESTVHEYRYRMLEEVYRWALGARENGWTVEQTPVLHFAYVLDPNTLPPADQRAIYLDLADLKLVTPEGEFYLPEDGTGTGEEEREIWRKYVVPYFQAGTGWEPRLLMRNGAYSLFE